MTAPTVPLFVGPVALVLASASPQRTAILAQLGVPHEVRPTHVDELTDGAADAVALENARRKALAGSRAAEVGRLVLGSDTVVDLGGRVLGKPADAAAAEDGLRALAGRTQRVVGGLALARDGVVLADGLAVTEVRFRTLEAEAVRRYVATGEWRGRAGGYAIQGRGAALVAAVCGDFLNVVGLPVALLGDLAPAVLGP